MRKSALILAGAVVFDLGVMVVSGQARTPPPQEANRSASTGGGSTNQWPKGNNIPSPQARADYLKRSDGYLKIKLDGINTRQACLARSGRVIDYEGVQQCEIQVQPVNDAPTTPVAPRSPRN